MLNLQRLSVRYGAKGWPTVLWHLVFGSFSTIGLVALCQTSWFFHGAKLSNAPGFSPPIAIYGPGVYFYIACFGLAVVALLVNSIRDLHQTSGAEHAELAFILIGGIAAFGFSVLFSFVLGFFFDPNRLIWFAPFRVILFSIVISYGIATRKMMEVSFFLRRAIVASGPHLLLARPLRHRLETGDIGLHPSPA